MTDDEDQTPTYELIMPFVLVQSAGGPYEDAAYESGWRMGTLDTTLKLAKAFQFSPNAIYAPRVDRPQIDLIAMKHGFIVGTDELELEDDPDRRFYGYRFTPYPEEF